MDEAQWLEQVHIDVSGEIGRNRQRQRQEPEHERAAGEIMRRDQPCGAGTDRERDDTDADQEGCGVAQRLRQHIGDQMLPKLRLRLQRQ
jgi:hypothetical protein